MKCAKQRTLCLLDSGREEEALTLLKEEQEYFAGSKNFTLLLAKAYLGVGNTFWALNVLNDYYNEHPDDCEVLSWIVWLNIQDGFLDEAENLLNERKCSDEDENTVSRILMLETFLEFQRAEKEGKPVSKFEKKHKIKKIFPEDLNLYRFNRSVLHPNYIMPLTIKAEAGGGYTTNALMGSPSDPTFAEEMDSSLISFDLWTRFFPPLSKWVNPSIELMARGIYFLKKTEGADDYPQQYSYVNAGLRPGFLFFKEHFPRFFIGYKGDFLFINKPTQYEEDTPVFFYEGHRVELELELFPHLTLFGGAGKRLFDEMARTRWELDGGIGGGRTFWGRLSLLGAITVHYFQAAGKEYNNFGVVGLLAALVNVWKGLQFKALLSLGMDNYMDSMGYFVQDKARKDSLVKASAQVLSPSWKGLRGAVVYEFSDKFSTVEAYEYLDHRVMVKLMWYYNFDLFKPKARAGTEHIPMVYGLETGAGEEVTERIQDLLRQDESVTRGSSCME